MAGAHVHGAALGGRAAALGHGDRQGARSLPAFVDVIDNYDIVPGFAQWPAALFMVASEFILGTWLLSGWRPQGALALAIALHLVFTVFVLVALLRDVDVPNCGCFGRFWARPLRWRTAIEDLAVAAILVVALLLVRRERLPPA